MTTQEAIEILRDTPIDIRSRKEDDIHTLYAMAQNMAINALKSFENDTETKSYSKDTISRQAAIDLVRDVCDAIMSGCESWYDPETKDEVYEDIREVDAILKCNKEIRIALRSMPSAQPERCKGEWIDRNNIQVGWDKLDKSCPADSCKCSNCGEWLVASDEYYVKGNFCPNCGADMRGEQNEIN